MVLVDNIGDQGSIAEEDCRCMRRCGLASSS